MTPALFLDRDGVINVDHAYVHRAQDFDFMPGIFELVRSARGLGMRVVVVTNQAGIGRGYYTEADFAALTAWMCERFAEQGAAIDRVYHCPTHPTEGIGAYRIDSPMRKPHPGMLLAARDDLGLDMPASVMLGDKVGDVQAGLAAGVGLNLLLAGDAAGLQPPPGGERVTTLDAARTRLLQHGAMRGMPGTR
jgi:D-glycero-D-manno-heptose 1,7-bisphosphate phosphatase